MLTRAKDKGLVPWCSLLLHAALDLAGTQVWPAPWSWHSSAMLALRHQAFLILHRACLQSATSHNDDAHFLGHTCGLCNMHERFHAAWGHTSCHMTLGRACTVHACHFRHRNMILPCAADPHYICLQQVAEQGPLPNPPDHYGPAQSLNRSLQSRLGEHQLVPLQNAVHIHALLRQYIHPWQVASSSPHLWAAFAGLLSAPAYPQAAQPDWLCLLVQAVCLAEQLRSGPPMDSSTLKC